jgi:hypothetical protein
VIEKSRIFGLKTKRTPAMSFTAECGLLQESETMSGQHSCGKHGDRAEENRLRAGQSVEREFGFYCFPTTTLHPADGVFR